MENGQMFARLIEEYGSLEKQEEEQEEAEEERDNNVYGLKRW